MKSDNALNVLLVHALETADSAGEIEHLSLADRLQASKAAEGDVEKRAGAMRVNLEKKHRSVRAALSAVKSRSWIGWAVVVVCLIAGFFSNKLGDSKVIDVLAFPLLGVLIWNLLVYLLIGIGAFKKGNEPGWIAKIIDGIGERMASNKLGGEAEGALEKGLREFGANWLQVTAPARESRIRFMLHIAAAVLAVGMIGGMYWKGLAVEYKAGWESTFITKAEPVQQFYSALFKPASLVSGIDAPSLEDVKQARLGEGKAAVWIHLFATTVLIVVFVPRLLLAIFAWRRARRLEGDLDVESIDPPYFRRLEKATLGGTSMALVVPHRIDPSPALRSAVRSYLHDQWGGALVIEFADEVGYGYEEDAAERLPLDRDVSYIAFLMNLASTPEEESQGLLVDTLVRVSAEVEKLVLLDTTSFTERFDGMPEKDRRIEERTQAWERLMKSRNLDVRVLSK
jgi:hypothetical protein